MEKTTIIKISILVGIIILISTIFSIINMGNNKIYNNISVQGSTVSGKTEQEAIEQITKQYREKSLKGIILKHGEFEIQISYDQLNIETNINDTVQKAYSVGRKGNILTNNYAILSTLIIHRNIEMQYAINETSLEQIIQDTESKLPDVAKDNSYEIDGNNLIISKGKSGVIIDKEELKRKIQENIRNLTDTENTIEIPTKNKEPEAIDIEKIAKEITKEPQDAYITKDPLVVHADENGIELGITIDEAKEILKEDKEEYTIPLKITSANKKVIDLGEDAFPNLLATFTTNYDSSNTNRDNNITLATAKLNGAIVNPGEEFSYNKQVGKRTIEAGFKEAKAYAGGKVVLDVGGGICQVSSTLYNTALLANLDITERHNHYFRTSYVADGRDATVSWGTLDFKFKNTRKYPIKIVAQAGDGVVKIDIYGIKQEDDYTVEIESVITNIIESKTEYITDTSLTPGTEKVTQKGANGSTSEAYKKLIKNGVIVSRTLLSKDTYNALPTIIKRNS